MAHFTLDMQQVYTWVWLLSPNISSNNTEKIQCKNGVFLFLSSIRCSPYEHHYLGNTVGVHQPSFLSDGVARAAAFPDFVFFSSFNPTLLYHHSFSYQPIFVPASISLNFSFFFLDQGPVWSLSSFRISTFHNL